MTPRSLKFLAFSALITASTALAADATQAVMPKQHQALFDKYCMDCHDAATEKGEFNLEDLSFEVSSSIETAREFFTKWKKRAVRSRLPVFVKLAKSLEASLPELLNYFTHQISNAMSEGFNSVIQQLKAAARGFRNFPVTAAASSSSAANSISNPPSDHTPFTEEPKTGKPPSSSPSLRRFAAA